MKNLRTSWILLILGGMTLLTAVWRGAWLEPVYPRVVRAETAIRKLPPEQDGLVIAVLSDFHFRRPEPVMKRVAGVIRREKPDLVVMLGDYRDRRLADFPECDVSRYLALCREGVPALGIRGNHDADLEAAGAGDTPAMLAAAGIPLLAGDRVVLQLRGKPLQICGAGGGADAWYEMTCALAERDPTLPVIGLAHSPEVIGGLPVAPPDLMICGHTHNGQIRLPFLRDILEALNREWRLNFDHGVYELPQTVLAVTSGLGMTRLPFRWRNPCEVLLLTLRTADGP